MCRRSSGGSLVRSGEIWVVVVFVDVIAVAGQASFGGTLDKINEGLESS